MNVSYSLLKLIFLMYKMIFIPSVRVFGLENLIEGPKILIANHPNATDCCILPYIFPGRLTFLIQSDIFKLPIIGTLLRRSGQIPVIRGQGKDALESAMARLSEGGTVVIFPEGKLNHGKMLHRAGFGAALLAKRSGAPVIPIGFYVSPQDTFIIKGIIHGRRTFAHWQVRGCCHVNIGKPWNVKELPLEIRPGLRLRDITDRMMAQIEVLVQEIHVTAYRQEKSCEFSFN
jgi:1-acyl-sn-glycerol-3-phosphate acyltransferase